MSQLCEDCRALGLPVFPVRYAVAPDTLIGNSISPFSGERVVDVELGGGSVYTLRTLRSGFLYVFHEKGMHGVNYWDVYAVANDGTLWKQSSALAARPVSAPQCARTGHSATRMQYFVIEKPEKSGTVWLAFSEHKWSRDTLERYRNDAGARAKRMQKIEPAEWVAAQIVGEHKAILAEPENFQKIVEYSSAVIRHVAHNEPLACGHAAPAPAVATSPTGQYDAAALRHCSSRYPWVMRNVPADEQAEALLQSMGNVLDAYNGDASKKQPMAVALWDAIGIVHELNGYRNDAMGYFARYSEAHARHLHAMQGINAAKVAVEQGAQNGARSDISNLFGDNQPEPRPEGRGDREVAPTLRRAGMRNASAFMRDYHRVRVDYRNSRIELPTFRQRRDALLQQYGAEDAALPGVRAELARDEQALGVFRQNVQRHTELASAKAWPKYEERLNRTRLNAFDANFQRLNTEREQILAQRLVPLKAWLESELFLDTLEDFHTSNLDDGTQYSEVIASAIDSLPIDAAGTALLDELIARTNLSERNALVWRAVALNQSSTNKALTKFLEVSTANKNTLMQTGLGAFSNAMEMLKPLTDAYSEARQKRLPQMPSVTTQIQHITGQDRLVLAIGDAVFERFRANAIGEYVGESLVKGLFLRRVGVNANELADLIQTEAEHQPVLREAFFKKVKEFRQQGSNTPMSDTWGWLGQHQSAQIMREKWSRLTTGHLNSAHLATIVALCEAYNFGKILLSQADKTGSDYAMLLAAGMSAVGALAMVALEPSRQLFGETSRSFQRWQMLGGLLAGGASLIGAVVDLREARTNLRRGYFLVTTLYIGKGLSGFLVGGAFLVTGLTASAPLIQRLAGRGAAVIFLERMGSSLATAAAMRGGQVVAQRSALVLIGRGILMLTGWKVTVAVLAVQGMIWIFTPNKLEQWIDGTPFGERGQHPSLQQQDKKYGEALAEVGV